MNEAMEIKFRVKRALEALTMLGSSPLPSEEFVAKNLDNVEAQIDLLTEGTPEGATPAVGVEGLPPMPEEANPVPQNTKADVLIEQRFVNRQAGHNKEWSAKVISLGDGFAVIVHWGKIGTRGQEKVYKYRTQGSAVNFFNEKCAEKLGKGYVRD